MWSHHPGQTLLTQWAPCPPASTAPRSPRGGDHRCPGGETCDLVTSELILAQLLQMNSQKVRGCTPGSSRPGTAASWSGAGGWGRGET